MLIQHTMTNIKLIVKCIECQKFKTDAGWKHTKQIPGSSVIYSHGFCPDCLEKAMTALERNESFVKLRMAS